MDRFLCHKFCCRHSDVMCSFCLLASMPQFLIPTPAFDICILMMLENRHSIIVKKNYVRGQLSKRACEHLIYTKMALSTLKKKIHFLEIKKYMFFCCLSLYLEGDSVTLSKIPGTYRNIHFHLAITIWCTVLYI